MRISRWRAVAAGVGLVVAVAAVGVAYASVPDSGGVVHGCYSPNGAKTMNGTQLNIIDSNSASCNKSQMELTWNQVGRPGADGVSVTSAALSAGDTNCPFGGSAFTGVSGSTYACNGATGEKGETGDTGATGEPGPPGSAPVFTNYGDGLHNISDGNTQTVASLTLPTGNYTLSATVSVQSDGARFGQCFLIPSPPVNGTVALAEVHDAAARLPLIGDVTVTTATLPVYLRCYALDGDIKASGAIIATRVGTITPSE